MPVRITIQYPDSGLLPGEREILESFEDDLKSNLLRWTGTTSQKYSWHMQQRGEERVGLLVCNWTEEKVFERRISALEVKSPDDRKKLICEITRERNEILTQPSSSSQADTQSPDTTPSV